MLAFLARYNTGIEFWSPPCYGEGAKNVRIQHKFRKVSARRKGSQPALEKCEMGFLVVVVGELVGNIEHDTTHCVLGVIGRNGGTQWGDGFNLLHRVEILSVVELHVGDHEGLEPRANSTSRLSNAFRYSANLSSALPDHGDDSVGFTERVSAQHNYIVSVGGHTPIVALCGGGGPPTRENGSMDALFVIPAWLDLIAVGIGAAQGAMFSSRYRGADLDLLGVAIIGIVSGFGGSIVRDILLATDISAFHSNAFFVTAVLSALGGMLISSLLHKLEMVINVFDALTMGIFGAIGTTKALSFGIPVVPALVIGVAAAVGGSILRDVMLALPIQLMQVGSLYAVAAGFGSATVIGLISAGVDVTVASISGVAVTTTIRMLSVLLGWRLPSQREVPTVTSVIRTIRKKS